MLSNIVKYTIPTYNSFFRYRHTDNKKNNSSMFANKRIMISLSKKSYPPQQQLKKKNIFTKPSTYTPLHLQINNKKLFCASYCTQLDKEPKTLTKREEDNEDNTMDVEQIMCVAAFVAMSSISMYIIVHVPIILRALDITHPVIGIPIIVTISSILCYMTITFSKPSSIK
ncbi:Transmembrane domain-containing protein [Orpheovirus IHUMI-LCC2]|uniref:Transmembrane domain-containing protein n=1 Tax=Orpheovirus IHUMI-LCC2 TaxID=2023057 RepID=A0A2I2L4V1_9VIRU|nr:Transmembrane domain-containing protein [Orpheovirus IHUMI-LCC2]SNW62572.1 Transmembrane domain-containing protein [Orpheovirus IHUMI-LCC2]